MITFLLVAVLAVLAFASLGFVPFTEQYTSAPALRTSWERAALFVYLLDI